MGCSCKDKNKKAISSVNSNLVKKIVDVREEQNKTNQTNTSK